jgi:hypothetical protein
MDPGMSTDREPRDKGSHSEEAAGVGPDAAPRGINDRGMIIVAFKY